MDGTLNDLYRMRSCATGQQEGEEKSGAPARCVVYFRNLIPLVALLRSLASPYHEGMCSLSADDHYTRTHRLHCAS